ncbi:hypothetical protein Q9247_01030 [Halomonas meridiana]|uniref:hypothetical protein n=1 Tax=Vreelandella aquamarina TaxID=77097 RepID=UPI00273AD215|nr:hypothetical protein [Halomonas meridiana]MDP4556260.1 hypothetical protein [Halomonas meridiana]
MAKITDEQLSSYLDQKGYEVMALKEEAKWLDFSQVDDIPALIKLRISEVNEQISEEVDYKPKILKYFRCALKAYNCGDDDAFRLDYLRADRNLENARSDQREIGISKQYGRNAERSAQVKKELREPAWQLWQTIADEIVSIMLVKNSAKTPSKHEIAKIIEKRLRNEGSEHAASFETIRKIIEIRG